MSEEETNVVATEEKVDYNNLNPDQIDGLDDDKSLSVARGLGYKTEEEWKGQKPPVFLTPKEWIKKSIHDGPALRQQLNKSHEERDALRETVLEVKDMMMGISKREREKATREASREIESLKLQLAKAKEDFDVNAVDEIKDRIHDANTELKGIKEADKEIAKTEVKQPQYDSSLVQWAQSKDGLKIQEDQVMSVAFNGKLLQMQNLQMSNKEKISSAMEWMKQNFADKLSTNYKVETGLGGGSGTTLGKKKEKGFNDLDAEDKRIAERTIGISIDSMKRKGIVKTPDEWLKYKTQQKSNWAKEIFGEGE